jgi:hypothetical protein
MKPSSLTAMSMIAAMLFAAAPASADDGMRLTVDWGRLIDKGYSWLETRSEQGNHSYRAQTATTAEFPVGRSLAAVESQSAKADDPSVGDTWFGVAPNMSIVARDWSTSTLVTGKLAATDALRLSHSCRMVLSRIRLGNGRLTPFAQIGLGQWRVDTSVVQLPYDEEVAGQTGAGFELHIAKNFDLAAETDLTILYREEHQAQEIASPHIWGSFLAMRGTM